MTWAGIVACQMGAAFAVRTSRASLRQVGLLTNRHLLRGVAFAATIIYAPPAAIDLQDRRALPVHDLLVLACFPVIVWGSDELCTGACANTQTQLKTAPGTAKGRLVDSLFGREPS